MTTGTLPRVKLARIAKSRSQQRQEHADEHHVILALLSLDAARDHLWDAQSARDLRKYVAGIMVQLAKRYPSAYGRSGVTSFRSAE